MFDATSTVSALTSAYGNVGTELTYIIGAILAIAVALLGVGYGYRLIKHYVTGRKF